MKNSFSPQGYLQQIITNRRKYKRKSYVGVGAIVVLIIGVGSTVGYVDIFLTGTAQAEQRFDNATTYRVNPQSLERPDKREQAAEKITTPADETKITIEDEEYYDEEYDYIGEKGCNVLGLTINGEIGTNYGDTTSSSLRDTLEEYANDQRVLAILVDVDSGGGSAVAGEEILKLLSLQTIPVIAQVREQAASAAYMAILSADVIFAHRWANIGSIGVIIPLYDYSKSNEKAGVKYVPILTSPSKDIGTSDRALTKDERAHYQEEINFIYQDFIQDVSINRNLSMDKVKAIADGRTMLAHKAKENGLIDAIGGQNEVTEYLRTALGEEPIICRDSNNLFR